MPKISEEWQVKELERTEKNGLIRARIHYSVLCKVYEYSLTRFPPSYSVAKIISGETHTLCESLAIVDKQIAEWLKEASDAE